MGEFGGLGSEQQQVGQPADQYQAESSSKSNPHPSASADWLARVVPLPAFDPSGLQRERGAVLALELLVKVTLANPHRVECVWSLLHGFCERVLRGNNPDTKDNGSTSVNPQEK